MDYIELIQKTVDYIEEHIKEKLTVEQLAKIAGFSTFHFYKVFNSFISMPVMEYVQRRKLQHALYELYHQEKVIDVAMNYGFETHAGFNKAFKKCFGYSPHYYRIHAPSTLPPKVNVSVLKETGGMVMQPKIINRPGFKLVGYQFETTLRNNAHSRDIPAFWEQCSMENKEKTLYDTQSIVQHGEYGVCVKTNMETDDFIYFFGVEVNDFLSLQPDMSTLIVPEATYAVFSTPLADDEHFVTIIKNTWKFILEDWFPQSGYEIDDTKLDFEFYDERCHPWEYDQFTMEIHIPIREI